METYAYDGRDENRVEVVRFINKNLEERRKVVVDGQGMMYPYFQYDGFFYSPITLGRIGESQARDLWEKYDVRMVEQDKESEDLYVMEVRRGKGDKGGKREKREKRNIMIKF